jgi:hypothetical protein
MKYETLPLLITTMLLVAPSVGKAMTPWGLIAHRVVGRVERMTQPPKDGQPGFDVATVILNADATKV